MKLAIFSLIGLVFLLGTAQSFVIAKFFQSEIAAKFFFLRAFLMFSAQVASSTLTIKTFAKIRNEQPVFNPFFFIYEMSVTCLLVAGSSLFLLLTGHIEIFDAILLVLIGILNSNTCAVSFLRLFDGEFLKTQILRVLTLSMKVLLIVWLTTIDASVTHLLIVFLAADCLTAIVLLWLMNRNRNHFQVVIERVESSLMWGSLNATLRSLPRLAIFYIGDQFYSAEALVELRMLLQPRENLAKVMGIVNVVFFRDIIERSKIKLFVVLFFGCLLFQVTFVLLLNLAGLELSWSLGVVLFYVSASLVYGVTQLHWGIIETNQDRSLVAISTIALTCMLVFAACATMLSIPLSLLFLFAIFNFVWVGLIFAFSCCGSDSRPRMSTAGEKSEFQMDAARAVAKKQR